MIIKKINEFYYDENIRHYVFVLSTLTIQTKIAVFAGYARGNKQHT